MRQSKSKRLERADGVSKIDRVLIVRPKGNLKIDLFIVFISRIIAIRQLHVDLAVLLAATGKVRCEGLGRMVVFWDLGSSDMNAVDGIRNFLDRFLLGKDRSDILFQTAVVHGLCEFSGPVVTRGADTLDEGLFRSEDHVTLAERLAFHPGKSLGDLVQYRLNLMLLGTMALEQTVSNVVGEFANAAHFADETIIVLGRKGFVAIASTTIDVDSLGNIKNVELGTNFTLCHKDVGTLLAFVGVSRLERKDEAVLVARRSAPNDAVGQSVLGVEGLCNERDLGSGGRIHRFNGRLFEEGTRRHDDVVGG